MLRPLPTLALLCCGAVLLPGLVAQEAGPTAPESATSLLDRAIVAQLEKGDPPPAVQGFAVALNLREFGETPHEIDATLLYRQDQGGLLRLVVDDPDRGVQVEKGFDGQRYWLLEDRKRLVDLSAREYTRDREAVDQALRLGEELLLLLDLGRFRESAHGLSVLHQNADGVELAGSLRLGGEEQHFSLHIQRKDFLADRLSLLAPPPEDSQGPEPKVGTNPRTRNFVLAWYKSFDGRRVPQVIREFRGPVGPDNAPLRIMEIHRLLWREPPALATFIPHRTSDQRR